MAGMSPRSSRRSSRSTRNPVSAPRPWRPGWPPSAGCYWAAGEVDLGLSAPLVSIASMHEGQGDLLWDAFVLLMLTAGAAQERDSRYGNKPALRRDPGRRDWIELHLSSIEDLDRLGPLLRTAMAANA